MKMPRPLLAALLLATLPAFAQQTRIADLPAQASQGALIIGRAVPGADVRVEGRKLRVDAQGRFVFGIGRDEKGPMRVRIQPPGGEILTADITVTPRDWPIQSINGVPPSTVNPQRMPRRE